MVQKIISLTIIVLTLISCQNTPKKLPILGEKIVDITSGDTTYHTIPHFHLTDNNEDNFCSDILTGKIYVADFFFTNCPTMCPKMTSSLKKIQGKFKPSDLNIVSISIDPKHDTPEQLTRYINKNHIDTQNWYLLRGEKSKIDPIGLDGFFTAFGEDAEAPGGYFHSSNIYLIDELGRIRGVYDGQENESMNLLIADIELLLNKNERK